MSPISLEQFPGYNQNITYSAAVMRRAERFLLARNASGNVGSVAGGIIGTTDCAVTAPVSGMSVNIAVGEAIVGGTSSTTQSGYYCFVSSTTSQAIGTAPGSNSRVDIVCLTVNDSAYGAGSDGVISQDVEGTASASPVAPSLPATSLNLAELTVTSGESNVTTGTITNERVQVGLGISLGSIMTVVQSATNITATNLQFIQMTAAGTVTVPVGAGNIVAVQNNSSGSVTVQPASGTITGGHTTAQSSFTLTAKGAVVLVEGDGSNANVLGSDYTPGNGIQLTGYVAALSGQDAMLTVTGGSAYTLPSPLTTNHVRLILTENITIDGWATPLDAQWIFLDLWQPPSGNTSSVVTLGSTTTFEGIASTYTLTTGANAHDRLAIKYDSKAGKYCVYIMGQAWETMT